jgi:hypothetical protein
VHLGSYRFEGDPDQLVPAYDRLLEGMPKGQISLHVCVVDNDGITIYDTCPTEEVFREWIADPALAEAFAAAGLPEPTITGSPVHAVFVSGAPFPPD